MALAVRPTEDEGIVDPELAPVMDHYGRGALRAVRRIERGFVDENWCLDTERGRYFLKRRHPRRWQGRQVIQAQHDLTRWLRQRGFPAPLMLPTLTGAPCLDLAGQVYELSEYIEAAAYDPGRPEHLDAAARTLGRYHACVEGFAPHSLCRRDPLYCPTRARASLAALVRAWNLSGDPDLVALLCRLQERLDELAARFAGHPPLPHLVIHGDYYAGNLLFDGDRIVGVVDYDKANWQPRLAELGEALIYFSSLRPGHLTHLVYPGFLDMDLFARFVRHYASAIAPAAGEAAALPDYICCIWLSMSLQRLLEGEPLPVAEATEALREVLSLSTWINRNRESLIEQARSAAWGKSGQRPTILVRNEAQS